jgi:SAM-dependent methyltransferase
MDHDQPRPADTDIANAVALGWERYRDYLEGVMTPVREWLVRELGAEPGDTILELAAGAGDTGYEAMTEVGDARLITSDFSPPMIEVAQRRGRAVGLAGVEYRLIDAERIDLETDSVDRVLCRYGYMLMPHPPTALAETQRVLRPGGRLTCSVWSGPEHNPYFTTMLATLVDLGHIPAPDPEGPSPTRLGRADQFRALLVDAGFTDVLVEPVTVVFPFPDIEHYVAMTEGISGHLAPVLRGLSAAQQAEFRGELAAACAPLRADGGYEFPGIALCARAVNGQPW